MSETVRPIALALLFGASGLLLRQLLDVAFDVRLSLGVASVITFALASFAVLVLFPRIL